MLVFEILFLVIQFSSLSCEGNIGVHFRSLICILEVGQCQELPLFFQVIQWKFCGKTGNYLLLNRQKIVTILFSVCN